MASISGVLNAATKALAPGKGQPTVPDNCQLIELTDQTVLVNVRRRYLAHEIYTFTGNILLAVNPCVSPADAAPRARLRPPSRFARAPPGRAKPHRRTPPRRYERLPIYEEASMPAFRNKSISRNAPHVFASAEEAYIRIRKDRRSQSVVVSGESGAGKTETNKYMMRYLAWRSRAGRAAHDDLAEVSPHSNRIHESS